MTRRLARRSTVIMSASLLNRVTIDPNVCHGKPCVRRLRYHLEMLLEPLKFGHDD